MNYQELELIGDRPDNDCLELINEFADTLAWRELHHEVLRNYSVGMALIERIRKEVKRCTAQRLEGATFLWHPLTSENDEFAGLALVVVYEFEPRIAQSPLCLDDFLGVLFEFGCITRLTVSVSQFRYALACNHRDGQWQTITLAQ